MKRLLYLHNYSIRQQGSLNTTMLQIFSMCKAFAEEGFEVSLGLEGSNSTFDGELEMFLNSSFHEQPEFKIYNWKRKSSNILINRFLVRSSVQKLIEEIRPEIIFTREPVFLRTIARNSIPVIYESHNAIQHKRFKIVHLYLLNEIIKSTEKEGFLCLFSISHSLNSFWKSKGVPEQKLFAWHDGFDKNLFKVYYEKSEARKNLSLPIKQKIITYTGGLYKDREIENIIQLAYNNPKHLFLIIGGPEKNKIYYQSISEKMKVKNVKFTGLVKHIDIPMYLYSSDILLALWSKNVSTINYCSPLKLFEYMASGRVILAHDFPTIREVLEGLDSVVFSTPGNQQSLEKGLRNALQKTEIQHNSENLRKQAFSNYTWKARVKRLIEYINISID